MSTQLDLPALRLDRLVRDVQGVQFHPLSEKKQHLFTGRVELGLSPVETGLPVRLGAVA